MLSKGTRSEQHYKVMRRGEVYTTMLLVNPRFLEGYPTAVYALAVYEVSNDQDPSINFPRHRAPTRISGEDSCIYQVIGLYIVPRSSFR